MKVDAPGLYTMEADAYHADPCPAPSLSRSVLTKLVRRSEQHAYVMHPKLGGGWDVDPDNEAMAYGEAAHMAFLEGHKRTIRCLPFANYKGKPAQAAREHAYDAGEVPLLSRSYDRCMRMLDALENFRAHTGAFTEGKPEQTIVWEEGGIWCRSRVDWLPDDPAAPLWDLKTTGGSALPNTWSRIVFDKGYDIQDGLSARGCEIVRGEPPEPMKFCVIEQLPPFGIKVYEMSPVTRDYANDDIALGMRKWKACLFLKKWDNYSLDLEYIDPPSRLMRERTVRSGPAQRHPDTLKGRDHPNTAGYIESGNWGG